MDEVNRKTSSIDFEKENNPPLTPPSNQGGEQEKEKTEIKNIYAEAEIYITK